MLRADVSEGHHLTLQPVMPDNLSKKLLMRELSRNIIPTDEGTRKNSDRQLVTQWQNPLMTNVCPLDVVTFVAVLYIGDTIVDVDTRAQQCVPWCGKQ